MQNTSKPELILSGGDERIDILENGLNKYYLNPLSYEHFINRGSCTCNTLNQFSDQRVSTFLAQLNTENFSQVKNTQIQRLKDLLNYESEDKFDVFYAPSGSDLVYIPLLFSSILKPGKKINNFLTCPEELGSGSLFAARAEYFMKKNQFDNRLDKGSPISSNLDVEVIQFNARTPSGHIIDHKETIKREIRNCENESIIGSLVIGSKSGIMDNLSIIDELKEDITWVIDLCQFRNSKKLINELIDKQCMIMITGSKFYEAPPFCGAMLIPKSLTEQVKKQSQAFEQTAQFKHIFSQHDLPDSLAELKPYLSDFQNFGLLARWEAAISEMEALNNIPQEQTQGTINEWNDFVISALSKHSCFNLMPNQGMTNKTIISFKVKKEGNFLNHHELKQFHKHLAFQEFPELSPYIKFSIGQPVAYQDQAFIRLAIGAKSLRNLMDSPQNTRYSFDQKIVDIIATQVEAFAFTATV